MPSFLEGPALSFAEETYRYCHWLTLRSHSHFGLGIRLLPRQRRQAMEVVYAYCRAVDDVVDSAEGDPQEAQRELDRWRMELKTLNGGFPTHPITVALKPTLKKFQIPTKYLEDLIVGVEMDLKTRRYRTFEELKRYCQHVASVVGLISIRVFGCQHPASESYAMNLGVALQLTNILRDLKTDFERGRIYLPLEELARFGYSEEDLAQGRRTDSFSRLMAFQSERAWDFFGKAHQALKESGERRLLLPARIMGEVYARLLKEIERRRYNVFSQRISIPRHEQFLIAARCMLSS